MGPMGRGGGYPNAKTAQNGLIADQKREEEEEEGEENGIACKWKGKRMKN